MAKRVNVILWVTVILYLFSYRSSYSQVNDTVWTLNMCIEQALKQNIQIRQNQLDNELNQIDLKQVKESRYPSLSASASQSFSWNRDVRDDGSYGNYSGSNNTSYGISSSVDIYNGFKTQRNIRKSGLACQAGNYTIDVQKEQISLNVIGAYLDLLYANEQVSNSEKQLESTMEQFRFSEERMKLGAISKSEYLQMKSELATEKLNLSNAKSQYSINRIALLQLLELPASTPFAIAHPELEEPVNKRLAPVADSVFKTALQINPRIKRSELNKQIARLDESIAKSGLQPSLSVHGGLSTGYTSENYLAYGDQLNNKIVPSAGITLAIPIYQNRQVRSGISSARIATESADLNDIDTKNQLRKEIEQICNDVITAEMEYEAGQEKYNAALESYKVAEEKFNQGLINSVDFIIQKTTLITSENQLLQSKYSLIFNYKILDYYLGVPLVL